MGMTLALDDLTRATATATAKRHVEVPRYANGNVTQGPAGTVVHAKTKTAPMTHANPLGPIPGPATWRSRTRQDIPPIKPRLLARGGAEVIHRSEPRWCYQPVLPPHASPPLTPSRAQRSEGVERGQEGGSGGNQGVSTCRRRIKRLGGWEIAGG